MWTISTQKPPQSLTLYLGALFLACTGFLVPTPSYAADSTPGSDIGIAWLHLIDNQQFNKSWDQASTFLKAHITKEKWEAILREKRQPLGKTTSRNEVQKEYQYNIPGIGDGTFQVLVYQTRFTGNVTQALDETLILVREPDHEWRAVGYYMK